MPPDSSDPIDHQRTPPSSATLNPTQPPESNPESRSNSSLTLPPTEFSLNNPDSGKSAPRNGRWDTTKTTKSKSHNVSNGMSPYASPPGSRSQSKPQSKTKRRNQNDAYFAPDYMQYNPQYGKNNDKPVWSLAHPLPHVVRNGMRSPSDMSGEETSEEGTHAEQGANAHIDQPSAAEEPPAAAPPQNEQEQGKIEARQTTVDNRNYFNTWGRIRDFARQELAEWLGITLAMTLGMCAGLSTYTSQNQAGSFVSLAAVWGFAFMTGIYVAGGISGGHLNPAITISMAVWRGFPARKCATYTLAQVLGAITASGIAYAIFHDSIVNIAASQGVPQEQSTAKEAMVTMPKGFVHPATAFFVEFVGSAMFFGVIMALGDDTNAPPGAGMQSFIIGVFISVLILGFGFLTGGCFNPARDFGGRAVAAMAGWGGDLFQEYWAWWVWGPWIADCTGMMFGGFMYDLIIFTGGESPINYPPRRRRKALLMRERNLRKRLGLGKKKIPDLERAAREQDRH